MKETDNQPFILNLHDIEYPKIRELREKEFDLVAGGTQPPMPIPNCPPDKPATTWEVTAPADGGDVGCDELPRPVPGATFGS